MRFVNDNRENFDPKAYKAGLKVIAAGLPRCATSSIQFALENELGFGPCMHMAYIAPHVSKLKLCSAALLEKDKAKRQVILHEIFDGYQSTADFPGFCFVEDLLEMYPDAKLILNLRQSPETWVESITGTLKFFSSKTYHALTYLVGTDYWHYQVHMSADKWAREQGIEMEFMSVEYYDYHVKNIRRIAKEHDKELLEWKPSMGYKPICEFLGVEQPKKDFPRINDKAFIQKLKVFLVVRGVATWAVAVGGPIAAAYWAAKWLKA